MEGKHAGACAPCEVLDHDALERGLGLGAAGHGRSHEIRLIVGAPVCARSQQYQANGVAEDAFGPCHWSLCIIGKRFLKT